MSDAERIRVAFDVTPLITGAAGVARYVRELQRALAAEAVEPLPFALGRRIVASPPGTRRVPLPLRVLHRSWALAGWPTAERLVPGAELVHSTGLVAPPSRLPTVVTLHDLAALDHPELHPARAVRQLRTQLQRLDQVQIVLTVSHAAADDLHRHGVPEHKIVVTPNGWTQLPDPVDPPVDPGFLLAVGDMSPRKNLTTLLTALAASRHPSMRLVLVGPRGHHADATLEHAARTGVAGRVQVLGPVDDAVLAGLYRDAAALCFPSVAEGFGLPVLEALGAGLPVVVSDLPVLREIAGDLGLFVGATDVGGWMAALDRVVADDALRAEVAHRGPGWARRFTWADTARATVGAYRAARETWEASRR